MDDDQNFNLMKVDEGEEQVVHSPVLPKGFTISPTLHQQGWESNNILLQGATEQAVVTLTLGWGFLGFVFLFFFSGFWLFGCFF